MRRKDAILAAVIVNTGLLVVLFTTATKGEKKQEITAPSIEQVKHPIPFKPNESLVQYEESKVVPDLAAKEQPQVLDIAKAAVVQSAVEVAGDGPRFVEVVVKKGDFLEKIARAHGTSVEDIMRTNKMSSTRLQIGQVLKVPLKKQQIKVEQYPVAEEMPTTEAGYYVVKNGDSPWTIAAKNHIKVETLLELNHLNEESAKRLKPGDRLRIR